MKNKMKSVAEWKKLVEDYQHPHLGRALWQCTNTLGPILAIWIILYFLPDASWLVTIPLAALAGLFLVRAFIIFHDCGHGSFFKNKKANDALGFFTGMLTFTPYHHWKWEHAVHHATNGDLDKRGIGDVWTMTVEEYITSSRWIKVSYRLLRNPFILFGLAPLFLFMVLERFPSSKSKPRERRSVYLMNFTLLLYGTAMSLVYGLVPFLIFQTIMMGVAGGCGIWLFYVQHQFEDTYWAQGKDWDFTTAAMEGSSYYKLPKIMQWFSGNIGFHHIHHLNPMIPNYNLERCHYSDPFFQVAPELNLLSSLKTIKFRLWDEANCKMISFRDLNNQLAESELRTAA
jgi:omega-6 fatty acid desaturase (delta-12 desaturase)